MYNQEKIQANLDKIQRTLKFQLTKHSAKEIEVNIDYINNLINFERYDEAVKAGKTPVIEFKSQAAKKDFESSKIQTFIENETILCKFDCFYWMNLYYKISDITNKFIQYKANVPQQIWERIHSKLEGLERAIRTLDLKARQVGKTTFAQGVIQHRLQFYSDVKSMIASKDQPSSAMMATMFIDSLNLQPFWLRSNVLSFETGAFWKFDNGSRLTLGYGTQKSLSKGTTPTVSHLSEIALFKYPTESIENALIRAMHETTWLLQIFEGTAEGRDDYFHRKVKETIAGMETGTSSLYFSFIPYFVRRDIYPTTAYIAGRSEAYARYSPSLETIAHAHKARNYVLSNPDLRNNENFGSGWCMDRETMFWYETEKNAAIERDKVGNSKISELATFLSQVPADWEEAFQHAGRTIYPIEVITHHSDNAQSRIPEVYKLRGDESEISRDLWPQYDEILEGGNINSLETNWNPSIPKSKFEAVQIIFDGWDRFDPVNKILIWEHPRRGFEYGGGIDTSEGFGRNLSDNMVTEILRNGTPEQNDFQCAEFVSPELAPMAYWPFSLFLLSYYSRYLNNQILAVIEDNKGFELQNALLNRGWTNFYQRIDEAQLNHESTAKPKFGFHTDQRSRQALIVHLSAFINNKWLTINSYPLVGEMKDIHKARGTTMVNQRMTDKITGGNNPDDRFMAIGMVLYGLHRNAIAGIEKAAWEERTKREQNVVEIKTFTGYEFERAADPFNSPKESYDSDYLIPNAFEDLEQSWNDFTF